MAKLASTHIYGELFVTGKVKAAAPTTNEDLTTKQYVDNEINTISLTPGPKGDPGIFQSATAPADTSLVWLDTTTSISDIMSAPVSPTPPVDVFEGKFWVDTGTPGASFMVVLMGGSPPANPIEGQLWIRTPQLQIAVWTGSEWAQLSPY